MRGKGRPKRDPDDIVPDAFGPGLPLIREWTEQHYDFAGYVTGFDPRQLGDRQALCYRDDERVCIVTVGGSGVGGHLLRRVIVDYRPVATDGAACAAALLANLL